MTEQPHEPGERTGSTELEETAEPAAPQTPREHLLAFWQGWVRPILTVIIVLGLIRSSLADWNDVPSGSMLPTIEIGDRIVVNKLAYSVQAPFTGPKFGIPFTGIEFSNPLRHIPAWHHASPDRGDIVTFWSPQADASAAGVKGTRLVKRVVAVAGDRLRWTADGRLNITAADGTVIDPQRIRPRFALIDVKGTRLEGQRVDEVTAEGARSVQIVTDPRFPAQRLPRLRPFPGGWATFDDGQGYAPGDTYTVPAGHVWCMGDNRDLSNDCRAFGPVPLRYVTGQVIGVAFSFEGWLPDLPRTFKGLGGPVEE